MKDIKPKFSLTACGSRGCLAAAAMPRLIIEADQDFATQGYNDATDVNGDGIATIADAKPSAAPQLTIAPTNFKAWLPTQEPVSLWRNGGACK